MLSNLSSRLPLFSGLRTHHSGLIRAAAIIYLLHILFHAKIALLELSAFTALLLVSWAVARREARFSFHILYYPLFVYGLVSTVSLIASGRGTAREFESVLWFKMLIFPVAVILLREVLSLRTGIVYAYAILGAGMACWGLLEYAFLDRRTLENRISGPASHVMTFSGLLLPLSIMFLVLWWHERKKWQLGVTLIITFTLLLTFTRSVWLGWIVAVLAILLATRARLAFFALPALILFITFMPLDLFGRLISTFDLEQSSNFDRIRMIEAGVEMIRDEPLLGVGPANVKDSYALYRKQDAPRPRPPHLHNNVVQLWAERGIIGLAAYLLFLGLFFRDCIRAWKGPGRKWAEVGIGVAVSLTVAGLFEFNWGDTEVFYLTLNLIALVAVSIEQPQPEANEVRLEAVAPA